MKLHRNYTFDTLYDFINEAKLTPTNKRYNSSDKSYHKENSSQSESIDAALNIAENGYDLKTMDAAINQIKTTEKTVMEMEYSTAGAYPDVPEFLTGNPECMVNYNNVIDENKYIHIAIQVNEHYKITADQMINRAIAIASVINDLEVNGYRIKLSLVIVTTFKCGIIGQLICLKEYEQSMGLSEISGTLHPSFLRRIKFLWIEGRSWYNRRYKIDQAYGHPGDYKSVNEYCTEYIDDEFILIPSITTVRNSYESIYSKCLKFQSIKGAKEYVKHLVKQIREL